MRTLSGWLVLLAVLLSSLVAGCTPVPQKSPLVVFAAGSLIQPFGELERAYERLHPEVDVQLEYHGSIQVIRYVTEIKQEIDVVASADHALMPMMMYTNTVPETGEPYADWCLRFASNRLALAYTDRSRHADEITPDNWYEVIARPDVRLGMSDPRFDPSGYRSLMALKLAEQTYGRPGIFDAVIRGRFQPPISWFWEEGETLITVPELLEARPDSTVVLRGSSIHLASLVASGDVDYAFLYESVIRQQGFSMVELPAAVNLGDEGLQSEYGSVRVHLDFTRFASVKPEFTGEQINYGLTIPANAPHPDEAARFVEFLLSEEGRDIMAANYHPVFEQVTADHHDALPPPLRSLSISISEP